MGDFSCPVFVLHGDRDTHTHVASARAIHARAPAAKALWIVEGASHNDLFGFAKAEYAKRISEFTRGIAPPLQAVAQ